MIHLFQQDLVYWLFGGLLNGGDIFQTQKIGDSQEHKICFFHCAQCFLIVLQAGDTLHTIAKKLGVKLRDLRVSI